LNVFHSDMAFLLLFSQLDQILFIKLFFYVNIENSKSSVYSSSFMAFLKVNDLSLVLYSSSYTHHSSEMSCLIQQQIITSMLMILNFSYHSQLWMSLFASLTITITYPTGCLTTSCLLIIVKLSLSSLVYNNNSLNSTILAYHSFT